MFFRRRKKDVQDNNSETTQIPDLKKQELIQKPFSMVVEHVYKIDRGIIVTGCVATGRVQELQKVKYTHYGQTKEATIIGIAINRKQIHEALAGDNVNFILDLTDSYAISVGDKLEEK